MPSTADPVTCKETFLQQNPLFAEIELNNESKPIGKLHEFDLLEDEIWLLQCPKGMNITELKNQKLKMPGRTHISNREAVSIEFNEGNEQQAFAYCKRKGPYALRLLPVRGTIVVRDHLKAAETITTERAVECCPPDKRVPISKSIRVRHPLLGAQYVDKLKIDKTIVKRLQKADEISAQILKECLNEKIKIKLSTSLGKPENVSPIDVNSAGIDDAVEFVIEEKIKKEKKCKRKYNESNVESDDSSSNRKNKISKKSKISDSEFISKDLQWLQNI